MPLNGTRSRAIIKLVDLFPSLLTLAGLKSGYAFKQEPKGPALSGGSFMNTMDEATQTGVHEFRAASISQCVKCCNVGHRLEMNRGNLMARNNQVGCHRAKP